MSELADIAAQSIVTFPEGLPGFEDAKRFVILRPHGLEPLLLFQDMENARISLPVIPVQALQRNYRLEVSEEDRKLLRLSEAPVIGKNILCLAVLVLPGQNHPAVCNLFAPIVVNAATRMAKQVLQLESDYPTAFPILME